MRAAQNRGWVINIPLALHQKEGPERDVEIVATGVVHLATYIVDDAASTVKVLGHDVSTAVVGVSTAVEGAVKGAESSLSLPLVIGAAALGAFFLMKQR